MKDDGTRPLGDDLGPIGQGALKAAAMTQGIVPARQAERLPDGQFDTDWQLFEKFARDTFEADLARARAKAQEYGSHDLEIMATSMEALLPAGNLLDQQTRHTAGLEMAISFYFLGKAARMFGAWKNGISPGDDSWRDGSIYSMMARWVRVNGRWIG